MNNLSDYDPCWCDGHYCPKDCDVCLYRAENREDDDGYVAPEEVHPTHWMPLPEPPKEET